MGKLTAASIKAASKPGRYGDGDGLFLLVGSRGGKSWVVRVQKNGRRRDIGLGSAAKVPLKKARERAVLVREQIEAGMDPVVERLKAAGIPSFRKAAQLVHAEHKLGWKNGKHAAQWLSTLEAYAFPSLGEIPISEVDTAGVRDVLAAIWLSKPETARRLRQRIATVIDWSVAKGYRDGPLAMTAINKALPRQRDRVRHHSALPYLELPSFMANLRERETIGRLALQAAILTAARSGEVRLARWTEINFETATWTIPADRMKAKREHVIPLAPPALAIFQRMKDLRREGSDLVFPGAGRGKPLSDMTLTKVLRDMGTPVTVHGFRSTFRDWVAEATDFNADLAEAALAHVIADKTVAAYLRGTMLEKRRGMMKAWADYCDGRRSGNVVRQDS